MKDPWRGCWCWGWAALACALTVEVHAHRLTVLWQWQGDVLEIVSHADGVPAMDAEVELRDGAESDRGALLSSGRLDASGRFRSPVLPSGAFTIVVDAGLGHRRTLRVTAEALAAGKLPAPDGANRVVPSSTPVLPKSGESRTGSSDEAMSESARVVLGLTFLMAAWAALTSWRNSRRLAELERRGSAHES